VSNNGNKSDEDGVSSQYLNTKDSISQDIIEEDEFDNNEKYLDQKINEKIKEENEENYEENEETYDEYENQVDKEDFIDINEKYLEEKN